MIVREFFKKLTHTRLNTIFECKGSHFELVIGPICSGLLFTQNHRNPDPDIDKVNQGSRRESQN